VQVRLVLGRRIGVNDQVDPVHVDTAGRDVRRDDNPDRAGREGGEVPFPRTLRHPE
jgi:hypothetical protein